MKFLVAKPIIFKTLSHLQSIVNKKNALPILSNILIEANDNNLILSSTDMDISIKEKIACNVIEGGSTTLNAQIIYDIIRKLPDNNEVEFISNDGKILTIRSNVSKFSLPCLPKDEFPIIDTQAKGKNIKISSKTIFNLINKTKFAISNEETRYFLNGLYFNISFFQNSSNLTFVGTDGHRLATSSISIDEPLKEIPGVIIPKKTINELSKLLSENESNIEIDISKNRIIFYIENLILISKLIDGNFPDYNRVIPKNNTNLLKINRVNLLSAVDRVSTIANENSPSIKFKLFKDLLNLSTINTENSTATEDIKADYKGEELEIGFNSKYIMDILDNLEESEISLSFGNNSTPMLVQEKSNSHNVFVLMPMRVWDLGFYSNIKLYNFRNFENLSLNFSKNCNIFFGKNGSGKTNILEAISLFSKGSGFRKDKIKNMINKNHEYFKITSNFQFNSITYDLYVQSKKNNNNQKKILFINDDKSNDFLKRLYDLSPFLFFLPETERLFISSPIHRRNLIDQFIFSYTPSYNKTVNDYNKYIKERSKLLEYNRQNETWLIQIEKIIAELGIEIYNLRKSQLNLLKNNLNNLLNKFNLFYEIKFEIIDKFLSENLTHEYFQQQLSKNRFIDGHIGGSKIGPHKSDFIFYVNETFPVSQLSTGQQKTIILLFFLSHCKYLVDEKNKRPILLLDEICSHLDEINRNILLSLVESFNLQIFMTGTDKSLFSFLSTNSKFYNIIKEWIQITLLNQSKF